MFPEDWEWLRSFREIELTDEQARALVIGREAGAITNAAFRATTHLDVVTASQLLRRLRQIGLLQQKGKGAQTHYLPTEKLLAPLQGRESVPRKIRYPVTPRRNKVTPGRNGSP